MVRINHTNLKDINDVNKLHININLVGPSLYGKRLQARQVKKSSKAKKSAIFFSNQETFRINCSVLGIVLKVF